MSTKLMTRIIAAMFIATCSVAVANENISIAAGSQHEGDVETRNGSIRAGEEATIDGSLRSRNGWIKTGASVTAGDVYTRNGAIELGEGGRYGQVESRNGEIELGEGTTAADVSTRNGGIRIAAGSRTGKLASRNGGISAGSEVVVDGTIESRNGSISLSQGSRVTGHITTRNGGVRLSGATAEQGVQTLAGDIVLAASSRSGGDLVIEITEDKAGRNGGFFGIGGDLSWPEAGDIRVLEGSEVDGDIVLLLAAEYDEALPTVEIGSDAVVTGNLRIDSRAELIVAGKVQGEIERITH